MRFRVESLRGQRDTDSPPEFRRVSIRVDGVVTAMVEVRDMDIQPLQGDVKIRVVRCRYVARSTCSQQLRRLPAHPDVVLIVGWTGDTCMDPERSSSRLVVDTSLDPDSNQDK